MTTVSDVKTAPASGLNHIDALLDAGPGWNWLTPERNTLYYTYTLPAGNGAEADLIAGPQTALNAAQRMAVQGVLAQITQITGIVFAATTDDAAADIHFADGNIISQGTTGYCSTSWHYASSGNAVTSYSADAYVYFDTTDFAAMTLTPTLANGGIELILHELGHALGLKHPFDGGTTLPAAQDNTAHTLMSYTHVGGPYDRYAPDDIAALMWLYGGDGLGGALGQGSQGLYLVGSDAADTLTGTAGNDKLRGEGGADRIDGGSGIDTAVFALPRASYHVAAAGGTIGVQALSGAEGGDTLTHIERLAFADGSLAFDLDGHAGTTAKFLGAVFGSAGLREPRYVGVGLTLLDDAMDRATLMQLALDARLGKGFSAADEVTVLYQNLTGVAPTQVDVNFWTDALASGQYTPVSLALMAADHELNLQHVDLVGLAQTGLAFS